MSFKKFVTLFAGFLLIFSLQPGCKSKKEKSSELVENYRKERERAPKSRQYTKEEEAERERQIAVADKCLEEFNLCIEKCTQASCENKCSNALSLCEKNLPLELQAIKK